MAIPPIPSERAMTGHRKIASIASLVAALLCAGVGSAAAELEHCFRDGYLCAVGCDRAGGGSFVGIRATENFAIGRIVPLGENGNIVTGLARCYPYPAVTFIDAVGLHTGFGRWFLVGMGRHTDTLAGSVVRPTMIGTPERVTVNFAERQACPTMQTQILPGHHPPVQPPDHQIFTEQTDGADSTFGQVSRAGDDMPIM